MNDASADFDGRRLRDTVGRFATGVTIITARNAAGQDVGLTANSFTSVSLEPPLLLFCLADTAQSHDAFDVGSHFAVNVLSSAQQDLSNRFARSGDDKFAGLTTDRWDGGVAILPGCLANLECAVHQRVEAGDHVIVIGRVLRLSSADDDGSEAPLLFYRGGYAQLS